MTDVQGLVKQDLSNVMGQTSQMRCIHRTPRFAKSQAHRVHSRNLTLGGLSQDYCEFEANMGYIVKKKIFVVLIPGLRSIICL